MKSTETQVSWYLKHVSSGNAEKNFCYNKPIFLSQERRVGAYKQRECSWSIIQMVRTRICFGSAVSCVQKESSKCLLRQLIIGSEYQMYRHTWCSGMQRQFWLLGVLYNGIWRAEWCFWKCPACNVSGYINEIFNPRKSNEAADVVEWKNHCSFKVPLRSWHPTLLAWRISI